MGRSRARGTQLTSARRAWPLVVRRARAADRAAVLDFASRTWDGWDYVPHAWPVWLAADDGVLLVGAVGAADDGSPAQDRDGRPLEVGRPIAIARVALVSATEAWLEGIRVDPRVRGMDVATDLQAAELAWAAAQPGATMVRYATGEGNEGSHRLGARHGFSLLAALRTYWWTDSDDEEDDRHNEDEDDGSGFSAAARDAATGLRRATLQRLAQAGLVADEDDAQRWWQRLTADATFAAGGQLYEHRAWALQALTAAAFGDHFKRGEVLVAQLDSGEWALAILERQALPAEDVSLHLGLLCGSGAAALELVSQIRQAAGGSIRFRLPAPESALLAGHEDAFAAAGFRAREWTLHILERPLDVLHPPPPPTDPRLLVLHDQPAAGLRPPG